VGLPLNEAFLAMLLALVALVLGVLLASARQIDAERRAERDDRPR
jgi:hypothetical protein